VIRKVSLILSCLIAAAAIYAVSLLFGWFSPLNSEVYDLAAEFRMGTNEARNVIVVAIDRRTLENLFPQPVFPISRHLGQHTEVVNRLSSAGARHIVFDILFDKLDGVEDSLVHRFASVVRRSGNVILATSIEKQQVTDPDGMISATELLLCRPKEPLLSSCTSTALVDMPVDPDGVIRRCCYGKQFQGLVYPTVAGCLYSLVVSPSRDDTPLTDTFLIDYARGNGGIPSVSYARLLEGEGWQHLVRDKIAIIGITEDDAVDRFRTPISGVLSAGITSMSGVEIQAHAIETLLNGTRIRKMDSVASFILSTLILGLVAFATSHLRVVVSVALSLMIVIAFSVGAIMLISELSLVVPVGEFVASFLVLQIATYAVNLAFLRKSRDSMDSQLTGIRADLDRAGIIQRNLQPVALPENEKLELFVSQETYSEVGGDYYDIIDLGSGRIGMLMADVSGKGVSGSLIMANIQGRFREIASDIPEPGRVISNLNGLVSAAAGSTTMFATLFYGIVDTERGGMTYANAGHCCPIICSKSGVTREIEEGGPMIGPFADMKWDDHMLDLSDGDVLCLYSDGISEAWNHRERKMFDEKRIAACVEEKHKEPAELILNHIVNSCLDFTGDGRFDDDWTLLIARYHG
jgi:CHASE2 domain-containing sensor protein